MASGSHPGFERLNARTPSGPARLDGDAVRDHARTRSTGAPSAGVLFPDALSPDVPSPDALSPDAADEDSAVPEYVTDLHLDRVIDELLAGFEAYELRPLYLRRLRDEAEIDYRQEVFSDLERRPLLDDVRRFSRAMATVRSHLARAARVAAQPHQAARWHLDAVQTYAGAVVALQEDLAKADPRSRALRSFAAHLTGYVESAGFQKMVEEGASVQERLSSVRYILHLRELTVTVGRDEGEPDYAAQVLATFDRFRYAAPRDYRIPLRDWDDMNHVESQILDRVALLFPDAFDALAEFQCRWKDFLDPPVVAFDREVQFYVSYLQWMEPLRSSGLSFSFPEVSRRLGRSTAVDAFDAALATTLVRAGRQVVTNDFSLSEPERILVVTGPNQGGKSTFARMFGQLHHLASLGCPVPGTRARLQLSDAIFTHFARQEDLSVTGGRLEDDLQRMGRILSEATAESVLVVNEIFTSTTLRDAAFLGRKVIERVTELGTLCVYVTFVDELASLNESTVSMVSTVVPEDPSTRTYKVLRRDADGRSYAIAIARKHGLTYDQLTRSLAR